MTDHKEHSEDQPHPQDRDDICGAPLKKKKGKYCGADPSYTDGCCWRHTETIGDWRNDDLETEQDDTDRLQIDPTTDRSRYYKHLSDDSKRFIDLIVQSFIREAPFLPDHAGKVELLRQVAINMHKTRIGNKKIGKEGMTQEDPVGYHEEFGPMREVNEHTLHLVVDRLQRTNIRLLKELGLLQQSEKDANAGDNLVTLLSNVGEKVEEESDGEFEIVVEDE